MSVTIAKYIIGDNELLEKTNEIEDCDYNVFTRENDDDDIMILKHCCNSSDNNLIDIYMYDRLSMNEERFVCIYKKIVSLEYKIDHEKGQSTIMIIFDDGTNICSFKSCPIKFCNILVNELF